MVCGTFPKSQFVVGQFGSSLVKFFDPIFDLAPSSTFCSCAQSADWRNGRRPPAPVVVHTLSAGSPLRSHRHSLLQRACILWHLRPLLQLQLRFLVPLEHMQAQSFQSRMPGIIPQVLLRAGAIIDDIQCAIIEHGRLQHREFKLREDWKKTEVSMLKQRVCFHEMSN